MTLRPLAIDLCVGLGGWADGLIAEGFRVRGYDIVDMFAEIGEPRPDHFQLVIKDVLTLRGSEFRDAALIVASPPCQEFSYLAMPWRRGKQIARALRGHDDFPEGYRGSCTIAEMTALFDACFRIQREACEAAGRRIPLVIENVRGAQPWVGRAAWNFGSYYLWGDVPALMPPIRPRGDYRKSPGESWDPTRPSYTPDHSWKNPGFRFDGSGRSFQSESVNRHVEGGKGGSWFEDNDGPLRQGHSKSPARKAASAKIAKIPFALSSWIARCYYPQPAPALQHATAESTR